MERMDWIRIVLGLGYGTGTGTGTGLELRIGELETLEWLVERKKSI
jgi:hypothetical protein